MSYSPVSYSILFGGEDGNVHIAQPSSLSGGNNITSGTCLWSTGAAVSATWKSKEIDLGSYNLIKQIRRIALNIRGNSATIKVHYRLSDGTIATDTHSSQVLPLDADGFFSIANNYRLVRAVAVEITGNDLDIQSMKIYWRAKRLG